MADPDNDGAYELDLPVLKTGALPSHRPLRWRM